MNKRLDDIAREAARLLETGRATSLKDALHAAAEALGHAGTSLPGAGRVRKHAQAMAMQALGEAGYVEAKRGVLQVAEELMTALEQGLDGVDSLLMGRAAEGKMDAGVTLHIRLYTARAVHEIAGVLIEFGYEEPEFDTVQTKYGPVNRIHLVEQGLSVVLSRCLPQLGIGRGRDMFTGGQISSLSLPELRDRLDTGRR